VTRAAFFDLDDTLVDQQTAARRAVLDWAEELGLAEAPVVVAARWDEVSERHYRRYQRRELTFAEQRRARVRDFLPHLDLADDDAADAAFGEYLRRYEAGWALFDDAVPALRRARAAGLLVGVLTNGEQAHQALKLDLMGLTTEVDVLVSSSTLSAAKPDPRAFHEACERIEVEPAEALMVGNSLEHDVTGALAAGLDAVLLDRSDAHTGAGVSRVRSLDELAFDAP
jgi:putative hydrolase of the HAD superfamily